MSRVIKICIWLLNFSSLFITEMFSFAEVYHSGMIMLDTRLVFWNPSFKSTFKGCLAREKLHTEA